jgi:hypothetical protein
MFRRRQMADKLNLRPTAAVGENVRRQSSSIIVSSSIGSARDELANVSDVLPEVVRQHDIQENRYTYYDCDATWIMLMKCPGYNTAETMIDRSIPSHRTGQPLSPCSCLRASFVMPQFSGNTSLPLPLLPSFSDKPLPLYPRSNFFAIVLDLSERLGFA